MLPQANQARKAIWDAVNPHTGKRRIDEAFPKELRDSTRENEMFIRFKCGSSWQVIGSDNFNSLVGSPPAGIVYSEWPLANPSAAAYLRPILSENKGWQLFIYTPRGRNHGLTTYESAKKDPDAFANRLTVDDTHHISPEDLGKELSWYISEYGREDGEAFYRQEFFCDFNAPLIGAILGRYVERAERENRVSDDVRFDPEGAPIEISSDIGFRDTASWWFWQPKVGGYTIVDYDADRGLDADDWIERIHAKGYDIGHIWLPKDAKAKTFQSKHSAMERFLKKFGSNIVRVIPGETVTNRINAARRVIGRCEFAHTACEEGLEGLRAWCFEWDDEAKVYSKEPKHDWACFTQDTMVWTRWGMCPIMNLPENGKVLTSCGWKEYQGPRLTRLNAQLVEVALTDGSTVKCTPDHMFLTDKGWKSAESLTPHTLIQSSLTLSRSISMAAFIVCGLVTSIFHEAARSCTEWLGKQRLALFLKDVIFTIGTQTQKIIIYLISNANPQLSIYQISGINTTKTEVWTTLSTQGIRLPSGIDQRKEDCGIVGWQNGQRGGSSASMRTSPAPIAEKLSQCWCALAQLLKSSVLTLAAPLRIVSVKPLSERADTCCIHVPDGECFSLASGAIVHNSHPGDAFSYGAQIMEQMEVKKPAEDPKPVGFSLNDLWAEHERYLTKVQRI